MPVEVSHRRGVSLLGSGTDSTTMAIEMCVKNTY